MSLVSCGYEFILYVYTMSIFILWTGYVHGYINKMKVVCFVVCWDKHG